MQIVCYFYGISICNITSNQSDMVKHSLCVFFIVYFQHLLEKNQRMKTDIEKLKVQSDLPRSASVPVLVPNRNDGPHTSLVCWKYRQLKNWVNVGKFLEILLPWSLFLWSSWLKLNWKRTLLETFLKTLQYFYSSFSIKCQELFQWFLTFQKLSLKIVAKGVDFIKSLVLLWMHTFISEILKTDMVR